MLFVGSQVGDLSLWTNAGFDYTSEFLFDVIDSSVWVFFMSVNLLQDLNLTNSLRNPYLVFVSFKLDHFVISETWIF